MPECECGEGQPPWPPRRPLYNIVKVCNEAPLMPLAPFAVSRQSSHTNMAARVCRTYHPNWPSFKQNTMKCTIIEQDSIAPNVLCTREYPCKIRAIVKKMYVAKVCEIKKLFYQMNKRATLFTY